MKAVILAGGLGTRISEETHLRPKPMIEIGNMPILWHIMKTYSKYGITDFIICCGYKGYIIKEFFNNYLLHKSDVTFDLKNNALQIHKNDAEDWRVTLIDTGETTLTGGRLRRIASYLDSNSPFCFTYGDGLSDINIQNLIESNAKAGVMATVTVVRPPGRFGSINFDSSMIATGFQEKPAGEGGWINGGFFVLSPSVIQFIDGDDISWEEQPLKRLIELGELSVFKHDGFWQPMDTLRDKNYLESLWSGGIAPWKSWI